MIYPEPPADEPGDPLEITPREGLLVAFDAARLHEVRPVAGGTRDVIVDWFYYVTRHFTSRSSTSNSSVALGGMTPPAPRAP